MYFNEVRPLEYPLHGNRDEGWQTIVFHCWSCDKTTFKSFVLDMSNAPNPIGGIFHVAERNMIEDMEGGFFALTHGTPDDLDDGSGERVMVPIISFHMDGVILDMKFPKSWPFINWRHNPLSIYGGDRGGV